ncbi:MAG: DeoR/GlpR transcriptional regulator [Clostridia bacterium]|nr:DeoR/GlpR transcriptional regulator [Clostridia bacterium]
MLPAERLKRIADLLARNGSVKIETLAREFGVSDMTVRRDLEKCEKLGLLDRCYGGGVAKKELTHELSVSERHTYNMAVKQKLAEICVEFIKPGDVIYLDAGTTMRCLARLLVNVPDIRVVTNDLFVAQELIQSSAQVHVLGGPLQKSSGSMIGEAVTRAVQQMRFDIAFTGAAAINDELNVMTPTMEKSFLKRMVCSHANSAYLVVDNTKFHQQAMHRVNGLEDYTGVVTNALFSEDEWQLIRRRRVNIIKMEGL